MANKIYTEIINLLETVRKETRSTRKIAMLKEFPHKEQLQKILRYAYDSNYIFNVTSKTFPKMKGGVVNELNPELFEKALSISNHAQRVKYISNQIAWLTPLARQYVLSVFDKDLGIGIGVKTINNALPDTVNEFKVMLAFKQTEDKFNLVYKDNNWCYYNLKIDGVRCVIDVRDKDNIIFYSRNGKEMEEFLIDNIRAEISQNIDIFKGHILDCEIACDQFQKFMKIYRRKNFVNMDSILIKNAVRLYIFDLIDIADKPLYERVKVLESLNCREFRFINFLLYFREEPDYINLGKIARSYINRGEEGIIVKNPNAKYQFKRSNDWLKFKNKDTIDVKVIGIFEGEEGTKYEHTLGGLILDYNGTTLKCGSGFTDDERDSIWKDRDSYIGMMCEISYMEETKTGSLRHPVFERFRFDLE